MGRIFIVISFIICVSYIDFVIEVIVENLEIKKKLFRELEVVVLE